MTLSEDNPSHQQNLETDEGKATEQPAAEGEEQQQARAEAHRPLVREIDRSLGAAYGYGGGAVLLGTVLAVGLAWWWGALWSPLTWLVVVTIGLVGLFVVRSAVHRRAEQLRGRLEEYCEANAVTPRELRRHFGREEYYTFFEALFELQERRERLREEMASETSAIESREGGAAGDGDDARSEGNDDERR